MKTQKFLIITTIMCLIGLAPACLNEDGNLTFRIKVDAKDHLQENQSLVGTWYEVGSTENQGMKVIFTKNTVTAFRYLKDYKNPYLDSLFNDTLKFYDNAEYTIISEDTLKLQHYPRCPEILEHKVTFTLKSNDTLWIDKFWPNSFTQVYPPEIFPITLYRERN